MPALEGEDPLADTASGEAGSDNLMYPITGHGTLSAEQRWVLLGSPAIVSL